MQNSDPVVNRGTADEITGSDPVISSNMTVELQSFSTQMGYMLVVSLSDQAQEKVLNSPECNGAVSSQLHYALVTMFVEQALEITRSSPEGDGCRRMAQAGLKHDEQDFSGNAWQSRDLINKTLKRGAGCRQESSPIGAKQHLDRCVSSLSAHKKVHGEIVSRASRTCQDPNAMQVMQCM